MRMLNMDYVTLSLGDTHAVISGQLLEGPLLGSLLYSNKLHWSSQWEIMKWDIFGKVYIPFAAHFMVFSGLHRLQGLS